MHETEKVVVETLNISPYYDPVLFEEDHSFKFFTEYRKMAVYANSSVFSMDVTASRKTNFHPNNYWLPWKEDTETH